MVKAWKEKVVIPTYEVGKPDKNPIFLENRVYQGSSGVVYPYPVIESVADEKIDKEYDAVFIENEYIKVMVLPELGGRIQMAYDKIKKRHFVYYNHVIKPALVGLAGPWISGGIEFNWPQHHRPSTFMPVDCQIKKNEDGSVTVWVNEYERMTHQKGMAGFTLRPGHAYLEIHGVVYNPTPLPQTFLWWANPAVAVNDAYRSVFPPDINAVFDHGKRAVSSFPIATGTYYKMDYSAGVDIANYKNIKVPTSYMGVNSKYNFEGGYECDSEGGMLHVANHHVSPGKKQWTWGNGDFGQAWDRNLTDEDGPYIELMAGVFTENQPDFSWLMPYEEKDFTQYFLPYRELGAVKNATKDILMNFERAGHGASVLRLFATSLKDITVRILVGGEVRFEKSLSLSPESVYSEEFAIDDAEAADATVDIIEHGRTILSWHPEPDEIRPIPDAAEAALLPEEIKTTEQLYLTGLHLEQYRHATFNPTDYYLEALRRDPDDIRCNNAMGKWYIRKGRFEIAEKYLLKAVKACRRRNPNPYDGEPIYILGLALYFQGRKEEAYDMFYKATWNGAWQSAGFLWCSRISTADGRLEDALYEVNRALIANWHNHNARSLKSALLLEMRKKKDAELFAETSLADDMFNYGALYIGCKASGNEVKLKEFEQLLRGDSNNYDEVALDFVNAGLYDMAKDIWEIAIRENAVSPMTFYYLGWNATLAGNNDSAGKWFDKGASFDPYCCFPNRLEAVLALEEAIKANPKDGMAFYYLGNLYYDKRQYDLALELWKKSSELCPNFPTVWRNRALAEYNKSGNSESAREFMEKAFALDPTDSRVLMELDSLYKKLHVSHAERLKFLMQYESLVEQRDDLVLELATLHNLTHNYEEALKIIDARKFHPWEGGEGKVATQYQTARVGLALQAINRHDYQSAKVLLKECLVYPHNIGEGKLFGAQENDFYYLLGKVNQGLGDVEESTKCFEKATEGPTEPAAALYYNDAKPDKIFYAGLAWRALGKEDNARKCFNRLANYGRQHYHDEVRMDYFAVSLPDLLVWDESLTLRNKVHCLYLLALGSLGLGDTAAHERYMQEAFRLDPNHQGIINIREFASTDLIQ